MSAVSASNAVAAVRPIVRAALQDSAVNDDTYIAATLLAVRNLIERDGEGADAVREVLGLPRTRATHNHYFLNRALCGEQSQTMQSTPGLPLCEACAAIFEQLPE